MALEPREGCVDVAAIDVGVEQRADVVLIKGVGLECVVHFVRVRGRRPDADNRRRG